MHVQIQREGGGGVGGPDPIPGKSQVLSNSIEISIWTPPSLIVGPLPASPENFGLKNPKTNIKKNQGCFLAVGLGPPPPHSLTKKCACIDHPPPFRPPPPPPGSPNVRRNYMVMSVPWLNYPLTIEALTGGGGEGGGRLK